jgi:putative chitinase
MFSEDSLRALFPRAPADHIRGVAHNSGPLLQEFDIHRNPNRWQFFLAQIGHECGGLTIMVENLNYSAERMTEVWPSRFPTVAAATPFARNPEKLGNNVYANRLGNGPPESGDGFRYRGRGYIQITGEDGYQKVGDIARLDLVGSPDLATHPDQALRVVCGFWKWKGLNEICDTGDYAAVTRRINGGLTGFADRRAWLDKVRRTFANPPPVAEQPPAAVVVELQRQLQRERIPEIGAADGDIGPRTTAGLERFRDKQGMPRNSPLSAILKALGIRD